MYGRNSVDDNRGLLSFPVRWEASASEGAGSTEPGEGGDEEPSDGSDERR